MKIIHTSDWHIGQTLYKYSRDDEHRYFFNQLRNIVLDENPDALIVSGDIFHSATPTVVSQSLYYKYLVELSTLDNDLQIIVVAGNHDSPSRLEAPRLLWEAFNVTVVGSLDFYKDIDKNDLSYDASKIQIPINRNGEIIGWVLAVPFLNAGNYPSVKENDTYSNRVFSFYNDLKENLKSNINYSEKHSIIATGHFMISGPDVKISNSMVGGIESVDSKEISSLSEIDYWALGHIHHPQNINFKKNMRYSGSPFALTFNECYPHSVTVVDVENQNVNVRIVEIEQKIPLVDFPEKPLSFEDASPIDMVLEKLSEIIDNEVYVRLHIASVLDLTDAENAMIIERFNDKNARYCGTVVYHPENNDREQEKTVRTLDDFKTISPYDLGCSLYVKKNNVEMPDEMKLMFKEVCDEVLNLND